MAPAKEFRPAWRDDPPKPGSYRSLFKYDPAKTLHPSPAWVALFKESLGMTDDDFSRRQYEGDEQVALDQPSRLDQGRIEALRNIVGPENLQTDDYSRAMFGHGKSLDEDMDMRRGIVRAAPDAVLHPRSKEDVRKIVEYCNSRKIAITAYSGGSTVVLGIRPDQGGVVLVLKTHMNKLLGINETNQTAVVQPGMMGNAYEEALNRAPERFGARRRYTGGHFPQSFEISTVGGWIASLGSGQASTYYGDVYDLVLCQEYVTPAGGIKTLAYPAAATGPKVNDILKGSEGAFGILVEATMRIFRFMPENRQRFAFLFPSWQAAVDASREIMQGEFGLPAVFRISDPEETEVMLKLQGISGTLGDRLLAMRGYRPMERSVLIGTAEGEAGFAKQVQRRVAALSRRQGAMSLTGYATKRWEAGRYADIHMREDFVDFGIVVDTLETSVAWDGLDRLHRAVRAKVKKRPRTLCLTHASHFYPQGTNLYFIIILRPERPEELALLRAEMVDAIVQSGGSISHHHGVGKLFAPWMEEHLGTAQMDVLRALKRHFDPNNIMNPGGQLGLDLEERNRRTPGR